MLKQRIITGLIVGTAFILCLVYLPRAYLAVVLGVIMIIAAWEWTRLMQLTAMPARLIYCLVIAAFLWVVWKSLSDPAQSWRQLLYASALWWLLALVWLASYPRGQEKTTSNQSVKLIAGVLILVPCWLGMIVLHQFGLAWLLYILIFIWVADSGAYFAGKRFGKRKLAPKVSPGKTWEGLMGALLGCLIYAVVGLYWLKIASTHWFSFILVALALVPISVVGDLFESMIKRHTGVKDSGRILPGHGGVLDRIDSWTAAIPMFTLACVYFGWAS